MNDQPYEAPADCALCPRLVRYRQDLATRYPDYRNRPVPAFGPDRARLLIVGLAPGKSGANRTGRPFTGDYAGDLLYATLLKFGFASGSYDARADDGLILRETRITNAARCAPPENRPTPEELRNCRRFLIGELAMLEQLSVILALGRIAHEQVLAARQLKLGSHPFKHGGRHSIDNDLLLFDSYHCTRYNTNTGRLTVKMFENVVADVAAALGKVLP